MIRPLGIIRFLCTTGHEAPLSVHKKDRCIGPGLCGTSENTSSTHSGE